MGRTTLHLSAPFNNLEKINSQIGAGANVKAETKYGITPLHGAAGWNKDPRVVKSLISAGADVNAGSKMGRTPLHEAAEWNTNPDVLFTLINSGADLKTKNRQGDSIFELIETNEKLRKTDGYWDLRELQY